MTHVNFQLVSAVLGQLMQQLGAHPEITGGVVETNFELFPRTVERVRAVEVLLDQQRKALICTQVIN